MRAFALLIALVGLSACDATSSTIPVFGEPYRIERSPEPFLEGDTLSATVTYTEQCGTHTFEPGYSLEGTEIWLRHRVTGTACDGRTRARVLVLIDTTRLAPPPIRLYLRPAETIELTELIPRGTPNP